MAGNMRSRIAPLEDLLNNAAERIEEEEKEGGEETNDLHSSSPPSPRLSPLPFLPLVLNRDNRGSVSLGEGRRTTGRRESERERRESEGGKRGIDGGRRQSDGGAPPPLLGLTARPLVENEGGGKLGGGGEERGSLASSLLLPRLSKVSQSSTVAPSSIRSSFATDGDEGLQGPSSTRPASLVSSSSSLLLSPSLSLSPTSLARKGTSSSPKETKRSSRGKPKGASLLRSKTRSVLTSFQNQTKRVAYQFSLVNGYVLSSSPSSVGGSKGDYDWRAVLLMLQPRGSTAFFWTAGFAVMLSWFFLWRFVTMDLGVRHCNNHDCDRVYQCVPYSTEHFVATLRTSLIVLCPHTIILAAALRGRDGQKRKVGWLKLLLLWTVNYLPSAISVFYTGEVYYGVVISVVLAALQLCRRSIRALKRSLPLILYSLIFIAWFSFIFSGIDSILSLIEVEGHRSIVMKCVMTPVMAQLMDSSLKHPLSSPLTFSSFFSPSTASSSSAAPASSSASSSPSFSLSDDMIYAIGVFQRLQLVSFRILPLFLIAPDDYYGIISTLIINMVFDIMSRVHAWRVLWFMSLGVPVPEVDRVTKVMNGTKAIGNYIVLVYPTLVSLTGFSWMGLLMKDCISVSPYTLLDGRYWVLACCLLTFLLVDIIFAVVSLSLGDSNALAVNVSWDASKLPLIIAFWGWAIVSFEYVFTYFLSIA